MRPDLPVISGYADSEFGNLKTVKNSNIFDKRQFLLDGMTAPLDETNVAEEYCWAVKQAAARSCCRPSGSSASILCVRVCVADHTYVQFTLALDLPERDYCVQSGSLCIEVVAEERRN
jgi:hypothetical protein